VDEQESRRLLRLNELFEAPGHGANVSRHQLAPSLGGDPQNFQIRRTIRDNTSRGTKVDRRFAASQASADRRVQIGVRLKPKIQDRLIETSRFGRSIMSGESGLLGLNASHLSSCALRYESISLWVL
jgi:hypothetical protein